MSEIQEGVCVPEAAAAFMAAEAPVPPDAVGAEAAEYANSHHRHGGIGQAELPMVGGGTVSARMRPVESSPTSTGVRKAESKSAT
jgi:hypothetical protein